MSALLHFYTIKNDFITKMKSLDSKIQNNYDGKRPYIGVLLVVNGLNYYAPLSSYKEKQEINFSCFLQFQFWLIIHLLITLDFLKYILINHLL